MNKSNLVNNFINIVKHEIHKKILSITFYRNGCYYCIFDKHNIYEWNYIIINEVNIEFYNRIKEKFSNLHFDECVIQDCTPNKNLNLKFAQIMVLSYILNIGKITHLKSLSEMLLFMTKIKNIIVTIDDKYISSKLSVNVAEYLLYDDEYWSNYLYNHEEKNGLSEAYIQGIYYIKYNGING